MQGVHLTEQELSTLQPIIQRYHQPMQPLPSSANTCTSLIVQRIEAPSAAVWPFVRAFGSPQTYKHFIKSCEVVEGDGAAVGSRRCLTVVSGLPATTSIEKLEILDDENRVLSFRVVGGEHRLKDYQSVTSVNEVISEVNKIYSVVLESYVVEIPEGNTSEDTKMFVDTIVKLNLQKLRDVAMASLYGNSDKFGSMRICD
ncbi:Abscisic acid receptor PYL2 [Sesamum angolense]|uniref:Abscisic acid receptor PYL2 n=1 Tax=Sesamum angolense TaxID=2727404 RepID=A0AAE1WKS1_9LAMI|nr:Abscisic acid receptor PYL2 [Sesamum angolense]